MVVGCISESTRLDQEWCSKFTHSVETVVAVGSEYQVMLHFLVAALEVWLRWFNFVSGSDFIYNYFIIIFLFLTQHTLPFPQTKANKTETENKLKGPCKMSLWYFTNFQTSQNVWNFYLWLFLVRKLTVNTFSMIFTLFNN